MIEYYCRIYNGCHIVDYLDTELEYKYKYKYYYGIYRAVFLYLNIHLTPCIFDLNYLLSYFLSIIQTFWKKMAIITYDDDNSKEMLISIFDTITCNP